MEPSEAGESPEQPQPDVILREAGNADIAFVASSWRRNYDSAENTRCPGGIFEYIETQQAVIDQCLKTSVVVVAHPAERPEQILGWCCYREGPVVHYVYVKPYYRQHGIAKRFLEWAVGPARTVYITHAWRRPHGSGIAVIMGMARQRGITVAYNPALIFGGTAK